jgi:hypothetical protein
MYRSNLAYPATKHVDGFIKTEHTCHKHLVLCVFEGATNCSRGRTVRGEWFLDKDIEAHVRGSHSVGRVTPGLSRDNASSATQRARMLKTLGNEKTI